MLAQKLLGAADGPAATSTYVTYVSNAANQTTYTFTATSIGTASADRRVIVAFGASDGTAGKTDSTVTIGGITATKLVGAYYVGTTTRMAAMYMASVPTGTTADIVVTYSGQMSRMGMSVFSATGVQSATPRDSVSAQGDASGTLFSANLSGPNGGFIVGFLFIQDEATSITWSGITERHENALEAVAKLSSASDNFATGGSKSISVSSSLTDQYASCAVYMR